MGKYFPVWTSIGRYQPVLISIWAGTKLQV